MTLIEYKKHIDKLVKDGHGEKEVFCDGGEDEYGNSIYPVCHPPFFDSVKGGVIFIN